MHLETAVVLAGGSGSRARIKTKHKNSIKVMLPIGHKPNLLRNIEILRDRLGVKKLLLVVGFGDHLIRSYFKDATNLGVELSYIKSDTRLGIADALLICEDLLKDKFYCMLGDEFYLDTNHECLKDAYLKSDATVTFIRTNSPQDIARNYAIAHDGNFKVAKLIEKPKEIKNDLLGLGTFVLSNAIFDYIRRTAPNKNSGKRELIDAMSLLATEKTVFAQELKGTYININTVDDWHFAQFLYNQKNFYLCKKSLVIPSYNEASSIGFVINDFKDTVNEIIVVDGGSTDGTLEVVRKFKTKCNIELLRAKFKGYGDALRSGIARATGDIITLIEADATFRSRDIHKMFEYIKDCDMVIGTRTTRQLICQGANMPFWLRLGNVLAAKFIELLWISKEPRFTDVGCTFRTFWKDSYKEIENGLRGIGPEFSPEMMIEFTRNNMRVIEIPVSYYARLEGESKHSKGLLGTAKTAFKMLVLVLKKRFAFI